MFGNAPKALWSRWIEADDKNRIPLACRCMLVRDGQRLILFEAGIGVFFAPKLRDRFGVVESDHVLLRSLSDLGVEPGDIDVVVLSHLHFDHAGGLLTPYSDDGTYELVFPKARYVAGSRAWQRAREPHPRDRASFIPELIELIEGTGRLELIDGPSSRVLGKGFTFHESDGHTPGLILGEVDMPGGPVVFAADLIPGTPWVHLPITMGYDRFPEMLIDEKRVLLEDLVERRGRLFYTHDHAVALSRVAVDERGRYHATKSVATVRDLER